MRLLFAHDHRFQRGAGGELYTLGSFPCEVWDRYLEQFDEVHVIARDGGAAAPRAQLSRADHAAVTFQFLPTLGSLRQLVFRSPEVDRQICAAMRAADAVVARLPSEIGLLAIHHARRLRKPYAVEVVGCPWDGCLSHGAMAARLYAPAALLRTRRAIANAPLVLYVTSSWLQSRYPTKGSWVSASNVVLEPPSAAEIRRRDRRLAQIAKGARPVLGTVASLYVKYKGVQTALEALAQLRREGQEFNYRVLGPGPIEPWLRLSDSLGIADLVHLDGTRTAGAGVCAWLGGIDIHLQPSFKEGLPRATIEAMSRGVACIGSTCGGIPELLPPERLHEPGDVPALTKLIRRIGSEPGEMAALSRRDQAIAQQFDPQSLQKRRSQFYARLRMMVEQPTMQ
jgi:glycosyltransferase involved in cell wall biosynthesis